jgi:hypothetical protein
MISCGDVEERQEARRFILDLLIGFDDDDDDEGRISSNFASDEDNATT